MKFGPRFLRDFYYDSLVRDGLVGASICRADGRIVGFISYAMEPLGFMTRGVRNHPVKLATVMAASVLTRPSTAKDIANVLAFMRERKAEEESGAKQGVGEVLSLVADREYRAYVPPGGDSRLAIRLFEHAQGGFRAALGCEFEKIITVGNPVHRYTYTLPPVSAAEPIAESGA